MPQSTKQIKQRYFDKVYAAAKEIECSCGCGTLIKDKDRYGRDKSYVTGHNTERKYDNPLQYKKEYLVRNREKHNARNRAWNKANPKKKLAQSALRRARKLKATPSWSQIDLIREFYVNCPEGFHVDHVIPLQNPDVCGLHVLANLQYLTAEDNLKKGNKFERS